MELRLFQHTFFKSRLYCRFWSCTKSAWTCSRTLPPIGNFTLPWRHYRYSVVGCSIADGVQPVNIHRW